MGLEGNRRRPDRVARSGWHRGRWTVVATLLAVAAPGNAQFYFLDQLTDTTGGSIFEPAISDDGARIALYSGRDLTPGSPGNADGNFEIFVYDVASGAFTQATDTTGNGSFLPTISGDGARIAFESNRDLTPGSPGNADGNFEIFLYDVASGLFTQVTDTTGGGNANAAIDGTGTRVAFESNRDLTPGSPGNADGNFEIFLYDHLAGTFQQVTDTAGGSNLPPAINADGTRIAFVSPHDLTPGSPGNLDGNSELFLYDTVAGAFTQATDTIGVGIADPSIDDAGVRVAFESPHDHAPGSPGNGDGNYEIFVFDSMAASFTQVTNTAGGGNGNEDPSIDGAGSAVAFESDRDLAPGSPGNGDGNIEIFVALLGASIEHLQLTDTILGINDNPAIDSAGARVVFQSNHDLTPGTPGNADGNVELFLGIRAVVEIPTLGIWAQVALAGLLLLFGVRALRGR